MNDTLVEIIISIFIICALLIWIALFAELNGKLEPKKSHNIEMKYHRGNK